MSIISLNPLKSANSKVRYEQCRSKSPEGLAPMWSDVMMIPAKAPDPAEAHAFINYILRPDVIARISNKIGYPNPNKDATALVDASLRNDPNMYVPDEARKTLFALEPIPAAAERIRGAACRPVATRAAVR